MNDNHLKTYGVVVIVSFLIGIFIGYSIWGAPEKRDELSATELLTKALEEVRKMERENINLNARLERMKKSDSIIESLNREKQELMKQVQSLKDKNNMLSSKLEALNREISGLNALKQENAQLKTEVESLRTSASETDTAEIDTLRERISTLEQENRRLNSIIQQIKEISGSDRQK